jgi:hypothetical protein
MQFSNSSTYPGVYSVHIENGFAISKFSGYFNAFMVIVQEEASI